MLFGLSNIPTSFQGYINKIVSEKLDNSVIIYLDNILIYTKDPGELHMNVVRRILEKLQKYSFFVNLKKCCFHQNKVCFLRFVVSAQRINIKEKIIETIKA